MIYAMIALVMSFASMVAASFGGVVADAPVLTTAILIGLAATMVALLSETRPVRL